LLAAWRGVRAGRGAIVRVSGEPGIGKSRLARALADRVSEDRGSAQRWQCSRHNQSTVLHPVVRLLESRCRLERGEPEAARREKLREAVLGAGLDPDEGVPLLADLVTGDRAGRDRPADAQEERTSLLRMLQLLLVADPTQHPMLLVVEDLQ